MEEHEHCTNQNVPRRQQAQADSDSGNPGSRASDGGMPLKGVNPFTAELFFKAWRVSGNLVLQINLTVKYLETIYENVPHALRNSATYHN